MLISGNMEIVWTSLLSMLDLTSLGIKLSSYFVWIWLIWITHTVIQSYSHKVIRYYGHLDSGQRQVVYKLKVEKYWMFCKSHLFVSIISEWMNDSWNRILLTFSQHMTRPSNPGIQCHQNWKRKLNPQTKLGLLWAS